MSEQTFNDVINAIRVAEQNANRSPHSVKLLAVSKKQTADAIIQLRQHGQRDFGENYLQEAIEKQQELQKLGVGADITWHFIGPIQSNKTRAIAQHFDWVQSLDRLKIAKRLSEQRQPTQLPLQVCIQVNIDEEDTKSGVLPNELFEFSREVVSLPNIGLRGIMVIPSKDAEMKHTFARTATLFESLKDRLSATQQENFDTLSMGMSGDFTEAIAHGSTMIRLGTRLFGPRD